MKASFKKKKILIIDDNSAATFITKKALEIKNYEVRSARSYQGIDSITMDMPDLILLDVSLGEKDGRDVAKIVKANVLTKHIPILLVTGQPNATRLAAEAGVEGYLEKPFELSNLWEQAARYTKR